MSRVKRVGNFVVQERRFIGRTIVTWAAVYGVCHLVDKKFNDN